MEFKEAFKIIVNKGNEESLKSPFFLYSCLSDLCHRTFYEKDLVAKFYKINVLINFYQIFLQNGINLGLKIVKDSYKRIDGLVNYEIYKSFAMDIISSIETNETLLTKALLNDGGGVEYEIYESDLVDNVNDPTFLDNLMKKFKRFIFREIPEK